MSARVPPTRDAARAGRLALMAVVALVVLVALGRMAAGAYVEILWHREVGYASVFWRRVLWVWGTRAGAGLLVGLVLFLNLRVVANTLGRIQIRRRFGNLEITEQLPRSYVLGTAAGLSALLGLWFGAAVPGNLGLQLLLALNAAPWGLSDPFLGRDASFYVFGVPLLASALTFALVVVFLVFTLATAGYAATGALRWGRRGFDASPGTRAHLGILLALLLALLALRLWLGRFLLLLDGTSAVQGIFGYTDAQARLPALQTLAVISGGAAAAVAWGAFKNRVGVVAGSFVTVVVALVLIGQIYPAVVQQFRVQPNQLERERPFIEHHLTFTRLGFGVHELERRAFRYQPEQPIDWAAVARQLEGLPVWTRSTLLATYRQLEARRPYYDFRDVTLDRYPGREGPVPVAVAVREVDPAGIQDPNWQNLHLRETYVEGMGAVASLASERTAEGRPRMLLSGIPPVAAPDSPVPSLRLERPDVYFGAYWGGGDWYAVIDPDSTEFRAPDGGPGRPGIDFPEGIRLGGTLRTALLAWRFRDANLLFASELTAESRFVFRRRVQDRVRAIAPFLRLPEAPYAVVAEGRIYWILEGFTGTRAFPLSAVFDLGNFRRQVNYARNSVKVVVDAVTGEVSFYRVPVDDPLADAYARAFPGLFRPLEEMPASLRAHLRYSRALLALQSQVLLRYHQETAEAFHGQQDVWDTSIELAQGTNPVPYEPEYGIYRLPGDAEPHFYLTNVFVPAGRQNLTAIVAARTTEAGTPELVLFDVPVADQVPGPRQIEALVEQDPQISQQFSLWRTGGSEVWTGHLHVVPAGDRLIYMEPVFLAAEADAIPELRRFVVSDGVRVVMTEDLPAALAALAGLEAVPSLESSAAMETSGTSASGAPWAASALELLERAEARARAGDWAGFGEALRELRALLERARGGG